MTATTVRQRVSLGIILTMIAGAMIVVGQQPADAATAARVPAAAFLAVADEIGPPQLVGGWFAKYEGVDGESIDEDHDKWINIQGIDWGVTKPEAGTTGTARRRGSPLPAPFVFAFDYEKASPKLLEKTFTGAVIPTLEVELTATFGEFRATYLKYEMKNVLIVDYAVSGAADGTRPTVTVANTFEEIKVTYAEYGEGGDWRGNVEAEWKVEKGF